LDKARRHSDFEVTPHFQQVGEILRADKDGVWQVIDDWVEREVPDKQTSSWSCFDDAQYLEGLNRLPDGVTPDPEALSEIALCGERITGPEPLLHDQVAHGLENLTAQWSSFEDMRFRHGGQAIP
jgi:hypothetical protein